MNYLQWVSILLQLVENYAQARATGHTSAEANLGVINAGLSIAQHVAAGHDGLVTANQPAQISAPTING